jgi:hypothetical protein
MSSLLTLPLVTIEIETGTNEDWLESIVYLVGGNDPATFPQTDLRGIQFDMEVRRQVEDNEVLIRASTEDDSGLSIGEAPNYGFLLIGISHDQMMVLNEGTYVADIIGSDLYNVRRCITITLDVVEGITRPPKLMDGG